MLSSRTPLIPAFFLLLGCAQAQERTPEQSVPPSAAFEQLDHDKDGNLSPQEAGGNVALGSHFEMIDQDANGQLTPAEFSSFEALVTSRSESQLRWRERTMDFEQLPERWKNAI